MVRQLSVLIGLFGKKMHIQFEIMYCRYVHFLIFADTLNWKKVFFTTLKISGLGIVLSVF